MNKIQTNKAPLAIGPYSQAVEVNGILYTSGQIALDAETMEIVSGNVVEQTKQVFKNLSAVLAAANTNFDNVIKTTVFLKDMNDFSKVNEVYSTYFTNFLPARSCVEVAKLPKDVLVEIELIAKI